MNRYCSLLLLLIGIVPASSAQSVGPLYAHTQLNRPAAPDRQPARPKATENPFYVKAYGYYSLLTPGTASSFDVSQTRAGQPNSFQATRSNLGKGLRAGLGVGYIVSDFINVGVDAELLFGQPIQSKTSVFVGSSSNATFVDLMEKTSLRVLSIIPNVTFKALSRPAYYIYNRLGLMGGKVLNYQTTVQSVLTPTKGSTTAIESTADYTRNSLAIGYQAALGIQFRLSQAVRGFAEVVAYNQSFKPRELRNESISTTNGKSTISASTTSFKDQGDYFVNPPELPSVNVAINSVGVGAGLIVRF